jgi:large repetitive protein
MRRLLLLLILVVMGFSSFAQQQHRRPLRYDNHSNSFFSLNIGSTYHTSNVNSDVMMWRAGGFTWGKSYFYRQGSPVFFDLRGRVLLGTWEGLDRKLTYVSPNDNLLNGTSNALINYYAADSSVLRNFRTTQAELNAELVMHFNRLREATKWDFYIFGGVGLTIWKSRANLLNDNLGGTMYDYSQLNGDFSQENIQNLLDNTYETNLEGSEKANVTWMPHVGLGLGRQLGSRVTVGIEHKTTFARTDLWDGLNYNNAGQATGTNDFYHYTGLYLKWYLRGFRQQQSNFVNNQPNQPQCFFPQVVITDPMHSHHSSMMQTVVVRADIRNISNRNQITVRVNGQFNNNFTYNVNSGVFQCQLILNPGQNLIEISAANNCGSVADSRIIVFQQQFTPNNPQPQMPAPVVSISNPFVSPHTVEQSSFNLQAQVLNVTGREQIQMTVNGQVFTNFNFNNQTAQLTANLNLNIGNNTVVISATNQVGSDSKQTVIIYNRPQQLPPPLVEFTAPTSSTVQVSTASTQVTANVFHVTNKQDISVVVNGNMLNSNQFNFNSSTSTVTFNTVLIPGANTIQITGTNTVGSDQKFITVIYQQVAPQLPPVVTFVDPQVNPINTILASHHVSAVVQNITMQSQIQVWVNNAQVTNFNFNSASNTVEFTTGLQIGSNTIRIKATNSIGSDDETTIIVYTPHNPVMPPMVTINSPLGNPALTSEASSMVNATVLNVENQAGVQVLLNNQAVSNFVFNSVTHQVDFVANLNPGINTVTVKGTNTAGQAQASQQILYKPEDQLTPPVVTFVNPAAAGQTVSMASFEMIATVSNVMSKEQIQVMMNGQNLASNMWTWNANTSTVIYHTTLINGLNLFTVTGSNAAGVDSKTLNVNYQTPAQPCNAPTISLNVPTAINNTVQSETVAFEASLTNVSSADQITVSLNGVAVQGWTFNAATNKLSGSFTLGAGNNVADILANNGCGKDRVTFMFVLESAEPCNAPIINVASPQNTQVQTQETSIAVSASTLNIANAADVVFYLNGTSTPFNFDAATKMLTANAQLVMGSNVLRFESMNTCGKGTAQWTVQRIACDKPVLNLSSNVTSGSIVNTPDFNLLGTILNVIDAQAIAVTRNGSPLNFVYNDITDEFSMISALNEGQNTIQVTATNSCGTESYSIQVVYQKPVVPMPPVVDITNPEISPLNTQEVSMTIVAEVSNVTSSSQIQVNVNGSNVQFNFNPATNLVTWNQTWIEGQNTIVVSAQNNDGTASDNKTVIYTKPVVVVPPTVVFTNPLVALHSVDSQSFTFTGYITELTGLSQVTAKLNGQPLSNFNGQIIDGKVHFSVPVVFDNNHSAYVLQMKGQNSAGVAVDSREVRRLVASIDDQNSCLPSVGAIFAANHLSVTVSSTKDLSNVVLKFHDNTTQKFEGLSGLTGTFQGTGAHSNKCIVGVWIKSGCNKSNDGPGFGEYVPNNSYSGTCAVNNTSCGVNFNPGSVEWQFCLVTAQTTFNSTTLNGNPNFNYQGNATSVFFVPSVNGQVQVNGAPYQVLANNYYLFEGNLVVTVNKQGSVWNICLNGSSLPSFGIQNKPVSPCESNVAPITDTENNVNPLIPGDGGQNCLPVITTTFTAGQRTVIINSSLNLNNVVLKFHDNTTQQFNNLTGKQRTLSGTGSNGGKCIIGVWVKSGCNSSNDGPNYGEYIPNNNYNGECGSTQVCGPFFSLRSSTWEFCLETPAGTFNRDDLANNNNFTYEGVASSVYFYAVNGGGSVLVNGQPFAIQANRYYLFTGEITVSVTRNDPAAPGQWMICIRTNTAPVSGVGNQRPLSPCEQAGRNQAPNNTNPRPGTAPQTNPNPKPGGTKPTNPGTTNSGNGRTDAPAGNVNTTQPSGGREGGNTTQPAPGTIETSGGGRRP